MEEQLILPLEEHAENLLTVPQLARILDVDVNTILAWIRAGSFPHAFKMNPDLKSSRWRIPKSDLAAFIEKRRKQHGFCYTVN